MGKAISELDSYTGPMSGTTKMPVSDSDTLKTGTASQVKTYIEGAIGTAQFRALLDDATAADQRTTLGLGDAATKNVGTAAGTVAAGDHTHDALCLTIASASSRSSKDANGIWTTVQYRRADNTLIRQSVLSGGTSPQYTTRTETVYAADGTTVLATLVYTLTYTSGELTSEDLA